MEPQPDLHPPDLPRQARDAFDRRAWAAAYDALSAADQAGVAGPEELERLATAAALTGRDAEAAEIWARAHHAFVERGEPLRGARCAFWLGYGLLNRGEPARAGGWLARARRLVEAEKRPCVEEGYLLLSDALRSIFGGEDAAARDLFARAAAIAERFADPDLAAMSRHGQGRALIRLGEVERGAALLDEAMAAVEAGEVSPGFAGEIYCSVIEACHEVFDFRRAREWTEALARWCEAQPDLVPYRGQCLVRRTEILQLGGEWGDALGEASRACEWLLRPPPQRAAGAAFYARGDLHRLRGELEEAEAAYREASRWGRAPEPGLALLRLAQGDAEAAAAAIRRATGEARARHTRARLLPAQVEILLEAGETDGARDAAEELARLAESFQAGYLEAQARQAQGAVALATGDARGALRPLREAWTLWTEMEAPYEAARARVLVARACRALGDETTAELEMEGARAVFRQIGAAPDLERAGSRSAASPPPAAGRLTARELEVLRLVARGETNKRIAKTLFISDRTVARHVSNIFVKLGVSSRSAATAYAYEHRLV